MLIVKKDGLRKSRLMALATLLALPVALAACGSADDSGTTSSNETVSEMAGSTVSGVAQSTDGSGSVAFNEAQSRQSILASLDNLIFSNATAANPACPTLSATLCNGSTLTLTYNSCSFGSSTATWNGSQILTFTSGACTSTPQSGTVTFTRTFGAGTTRTGANGVVVSLDTAGISGWSSSVTGGTTITNSVGTRSVTINGVHMTATKSFTTKNGVSKTATVWDHSISTLSAFTITGSGASKSITGGTVQVQHNLAKYVGTATIAAPLTFTAGCCHATGGQISTTLSGSKTGTETLTYSSTCGQAALMDSTGTSTITLSHCL